MPTATKGKVQKKRALRTSTKVITAFPSRKHLKEKKKTATTANNIKERKATPKRKREKVAASCHHTRGSEKKKKAQKETPVWNFLFKRVSRSNEPYREYRK